MPGMTYSSGREEGYVSEVFGRGEAGCGMRGKVQRFFLGIACGASCFVAQRDACNIPPVFLAPNLFPGPFFGPFARPAVPCEACLTCEADVVRGICRNRAHAASRMTGLEDCEMAKDGKVALATALGCEKSIGMVSAGVEAAVVAEVVDVVCLTRKLKVEIMRTCESGSLRRAHPE